MHGTVALCTSVRTPLSLITQLVMVEESLHSLAAMWTLVGTPCTFIGNSARWSGGGVNAQGSSNVYISGNTTFIGNSAWRDGGGVSAEVNSKCTSVRTLLYLVTQLVMVMVGE